MVYIQLTRREFVACIAALPVAFCTASLASCAEDAPMTRAEPLVGGWKNDANSHLIEFRKDGTFSYTNPAFPMLGALKGNWYAYRENPVDVDGEGWTLYTTDSPMGGAIHAGRHSDDIGGEYQFSRVDFAVNGNRMIGAPGFLLTRDRAFDEEQIQLYLSGRTNSDWFNHLKAALSYSRT